MPRQNTIEKIKNLSIIVLLGTTIILLCLFWKENTLSSQNKNLDKIQTFHVMDVLRAKTIAVNFGKENHTVLPIEKRYFWNDEGGEGSEKNTFIKALKAFHEGSELTVESISNEAYKALLAKRSIRVDFAFAVPLKDFFEEVGIDYYFSYDTVKSFSTMLFSEGSTDSLILYNKERDMAFRLSKGKEGKLFKQLIGEIEKENNNSFYTIGTYLGIANDTMVPQELMQSVERTPYRNMNNFKDKDEINDLVKKYFAESFDFVRKIAEGDGTIIYVYDYGRKVLILNKDNALEYKEEPRSVVKETPFYFSYLRTALAFIEQHEEEEERELIKKQLYLKDVQFQAGEDGGYVFTFGIEIEDQKVFYENREPLVIKVVGNQVCYYQNNMILRADFENEQKLSSNYACPVINIIAEDSPYIYETLLDQQKIGEIEGVTEVNLEEKTLEKVAGSIRAISTGFLMQERRKKAVTNQKYLIPVWVISVGSTDFFFDLYTGEKKGYSKEERR